jgi:hypothetical protein
MIQTLIRDVGALCLLAAGTQFSFAACAGMDSDSHFHKLDENNNVKVYTLELGRLESTSSHCHEHAFFYVVTSESETSDTLQGHAGVSHKWYPGVARFVQNPETHTVRNESATPLHEVIVEILSRLEYNPLEPGYGGDDFAGPGGVRQSDKTSATLVQHGAMGGVKAEIVPGDKLSFDASTKVLIALTDGTLEGLGKKFNFSRQDVQLISPDAEFTLTNTGRFPIRFVTISY